LPAKDESATYPRDMTSVYKYAHLVIAATSAKNGDDGFLRHRSPSYDLIGTDNTSFHVQRSISHLTLSSTQVSSTTMPLLDRAWCFQERMLASRILHYTEDEMMWECQEELWCECRLIKFDFPRHRKVETVKLAYAAAVASTDSETHATSWNKLVREYSQRALTLGTDRLPGISGIAREIALPAMGRYLAGLWEFQLPQALTWATTVGVHERPVLLPRPSQYTAPTWSWASIVTAIALPRPDSIKESTSPVCRLIDVICTPKTGDLYGHVRYGQLSIFGPTMAGTVKRTDSDVEAHRYIVVLENVNSEAPEEVGYLNIFNDIELSEDTITVLILLVQNRHYSNKSCRVEGLALIQLTMHVGCWERIGMVEGPGPAGVDGSGPIDQMVELYPVKETEVVIV